MEIVKAERDGSVWIRAKVLTGKDSLDFFMDHWKQAGAVPFNGEFDIPKSTALDRVMCTDVENISHCVMDVDADHWDAQKGTVPIRCKFTGPHGSEAQEMFLNGNIRCMARTAVDPRSGDPRIITFDLVQNPDQDVVEQIKHQRELKKEAAARLAHDNRKK